MSRTLRDLGFVAIATAICAVVVLVAPVVAVRTVFTVPLCLVFPGWALTAAVFGSGHIERRQEVMLALGLSLVTLVLGSLILDLVPGGLTRVSWTILLALVVFAAIAVAGRRTRGAARRPPARLAIRLRRVDLVLLAFAAIAVPSAYVLSRIPLGARNVVGYTAMWMLPAKQSHQVDIGVISNELHATTYRLELRDGAGETTIASRLTLRPGQQARFTVPLAASIPPGSLQSPPTALLYKNGSNAVYRQVTGSLPSSA